MMELLSQLPASFANVPYMGARIPNRDYDLGQGANCQLYAYAALAHFGIALPPWRSSELWDDTTLTKVVVGDFERLDLLLFARRSDPFGAHVGVYAGNGMVLHLSKSVGWPVEWPLHMFAQRDEYQFLLGGKRAITA